MARKYDDKDKRMTPGPGTYKQPSFVNQKKPMTFPKQQSDNVLLNKAQLQTPAPGTYVQKSSLSTQGYFITPARPLQDKSDKFTNPGPGVYTQNPNLIKTKSSAVFGRERGREKIDKEQMERPGPGVYKPEQQAIKMIKSTGNITIGNSERKGLLHENVLSVPGPGVYNQSTFKKGTQAPSYGMGTGPKDVIDRSSAKQNPGPGVYSQAVTRTKIGAAIGNDTRFKEKPTGVPGPGSYALPSRIAAVASYHGINKR
eukprot:403351763